MVPSRFDAKGDSDSACAYLRHSLVADGYAIISGINTDLSVLQPFFGRFGKILKRRFQDANASEPQYFGDVRYRDDLPSDARKSTQGDAALEFHTAHAFEATRPRFFAMAMINEGWPEDGGTRRGESRLLSFDSIAKDILASLPESVGPAALEYIQRTPVRYGPIHITAPLSDMPLLEKKDGIYYGRCWERFRDSIPRIEVLSKDAGEFSGLAAIFAKVLESSKRCLQFSLRTGEILAIDNWRYAHGRTAFVGSRQREGVIEINPRQIRSIHVACQDFSIH